MFILLILFFILYIVSFSYLFYFVKGLEFELNYLLDIYYDSVGDSYKRSDKDA